MKAYLQFAFTRAILTSLWVGIMIQAQAQTGIDHWETVIYDSTTWRYFVGISDPGADWFQPGFNDANWSAGKGGIGYGDGDDHTTIEQTLSVFLRKKFTISDKNRITEAILHMDYDDGFIAYLNGEEIARAMMGNSSVVGFDQPSAGLHEALLYQGFAPERFQLDAARINQLLVNGENTLAIQVHNESLNSSDLTASAFFSVGVTDQTNEYYPTPSWFQAPTAFGSSNLPIIVLDTNGEPIRDDPRITATMGIIDNGTGNRNHVSDPYNSYNGKVGIELRGESSQMFPKRSFRIETQDDAGNNLNVSLLGLPAENDWVLYAPYTDKTMMRDVLAYKISRDMGRYAPRTRYAELVLNGNYEGTYVLIEKIKVDKNRVDIAKLKDTDISGRDLTGGYLLRSDKIDGNDFPGWTATPSPLPSGWNDVAMQYEDPEGEVLALPQQNYIRSFMQEFQSSLTRSSFTNSETGFKSFIDVGAAIDFIISNEIAKNIDAYIFSTYYYKEKDPVNGRGKLVMGPLWDFNLAYGNVDYLENSQFAPGWTYNDDYRMYWFRRMMEDPIFAALFSCRWQELRSSRLTNQYFTNKIDSIASTLSETQAHNYERWPILGTYVWPNQFVGQTYAEEINFLKTWILDRVHWMDSNPPGNCAIITSVDEKSESTFSMHPNPFREAFTLVTNSEETIPVTLQIHSALGKRILTRAHSSREFIWNGQDDEGSTVPPGVYVITVTDANGLVIFRGRIVKY